VAIFTVEMSDVEITDKLLSREGRITFARYMTGTVNEDEVDRITHAANTLAKLPIYIAEANSPTLERLKSELRRLKRTRNIKLAIFDYVQQLSIASGSKYHSRQQELTIITANLKSIARELELPIIILAQLNRRAEDQTAPSLANLKDSGSIEQDADCVMLLWREGEDDNARYFIDVAKQRSGKTGVFEIEANPAMNFFGNAPLRRMGK
jgi:replicative DNA helicase